MFPSIDMVIQVPDIKNNIPSGFLIMASLYQRIQSALRI